MPSAARFAGDGLGQEALCWQHSEEHSGRGVRGYVVGVVRKLLWFPRDESRKPAPLPFS
jgi:hypothetical protein